jgi:DNA-binding beta-propeller fold protein YncE
MKPINPKLLSGIACFAFAVALTIPAWLENARAAQTGVPHFEPDPYWPKPLPSNWMLGQVSGIYVDSHDHIWVTNRPRTLDNNDKYAALNPPQADCCIPAPAILEFDQAGNLIQGWGGPGQGYEWPDNEHGIFIDYKENVWVGGNSDKDTNILKFTKTGKFLLQIGHHGKSGGSNDTENLKRPAGICVYPKTNEVFVADGYGNRRVIVFDADTGAYKRHWGAYGNKPDDSVPRTRVYEGPGPQQFNTVHGIRISNDDLVYVGDRVNNRIQVFHPDGTFVKEGYIERKTSTPEGTAFDIAFSPDKQQQFFYVPDGSNKKVQILNRDTLEVVSFFGGHGGHGTGQFFHIHSIATDSKGNIYLGESFGMRALRWNYKGMSPASTR